MKSAIKPMDVPEACVQMELLGHEFPFFLTEPPHGRPCSGSVFHINIIVSVQYLHRNNAKTHENYVLYTYIDIAQEHTFEKQKINGPAFKQTFLPHSPVFLSNDLSVLCTHP